MDELYAAGTMHMVLTGGEPLLREDIWSLLKAIRGYGMGITLFSNGSSVTTEVAEELSQYVGVVELSLLAGEEALHDQLANVPGSFRQTLMAASCLQASGVTVSLKSPVFPSTLGSLKKAQRICMTLGVEWTPDTSLLERDDGSAQPDELRCSGSALVSFYELFPEYRRTLHYREGEGSVPLRGICGASRRNCFIDAQGAVYPCLDFKIAHAIRARRGLPSLALLGNVTKSSFGTIWRTSALANQLRRATPEDMTSCRMCRCLPWCVPCVAKNYAEHGELFSPDSLSCSVAKIAAHVDGVEVAPGEDASATAPGE
jgi:radical SAM protein with 4Fe4S-binding SPASM domain